MKNFTLLFFVILFSACSPRMHYLGDVFAPTLDVDVFYDEMDIKRDFRVMGQLSSDNQNNPTINLDKIKEEMIKTAGQKGADGIVFLFHESYDNNNTVQSKLIKYR